MKIVSIAALVTFWATSALAADNFDFFIASESGLRLSATLYATDGSIIYKANARQREQYGSGDGYHFLINRSDLEAKPLSEWCVTDHSGHWRALPANSSATTLCDTHPRDNGHGHYVFVSRRVMSSAKPR